MRLLLPMALLGVCLISVASEILPPPPNPWANWRAVAQDPPRPENPIPILPGPVPQHPAPPLQPITAQSILHSSAMIFSGTVMKVERVKFSSRSAQPITRITFRVQNAIRGVRSGQVIEIREWGGLWNAGER
jgi:hypothetical protein